MTSSNCTVNPAFCNWTVAYVYYCDGVSFSGDNAAPVQVPGGRVSPIFFRGCNDIVLGRFGPFHAHFSALAS